MNLFKQDKPKFEPAPQIDEARQNIEAQRRNSKMRGRAAAMLTQGAAVAPTAQRSVTGN